MGQTRKWLVKSVLLLCLFNFVNPLIAQFNGLNNEVKWMFADELADSDTSWSASKTNIHDYSVFETLSSDSLKINSKYTFFNWLFNKNIYGVSKKDYTFRLNPIFNVNIGSSDYLSARRGGFVQGTIGSKFSWYSTFYENLQAFDPYMTNHVQTTGVAPGEAEVKSQNNGPYDYSVSTGGVRWEASKYFHLTAGYGKNVFGNGYRSLLLSDAAGNYPFLKTDFMLGWVKHSAIVAEFIDFTNDLAGDGLKRKKYGAFHFLDVKITKNLKLAFFEAVIWGGDSTNRNAFDINYVNPFLILRPVEYNIGSPDNMLIGVNGSWDFAKPFQLYGQVVLDELHSDNLLNNPSWWGNKFGYQIGLKARRLPIKNLYFHLEYNTVRPFTYSHRTSMLNYGHNYDALAHPYGANFRELVFIGNYRIKRFNFNIKSIFLSGGKEFNDSTSVGKDIFRSYNNRLFDDGYEIGYGRSFQQLITNLKVGYILNPKYLLMLELGYQNRGIWLDGDKENHHYLYAGFKTSLLNIYNDF